MREGDSARAPARLLKYRTTVRGAVFVRHLAPRSEAETYGWGWEQVTFYGQLTAQDALFRRGLCIPAVAAAGP